MSAAESISKFKAWMSVSVNTRCCETCVPSSVEEYISSSSCRKENRYFKKHFQGSTSWGATSGLFSDYHQSIFQGQPIPYSITDLMNDIFSHNYSTLHLSETRLYNFMKDLPEIWHPMLSVSNPLTVACAELWLQWIFVFVCVCLCTRNTSSLKCCTFGKNSPFYNMQYFLESTTHTTSIFTYQWLWITIPNVATLVLMQAEAAMGFKPSHWHNKSFVYNNYTKFIILYYKYLHIKMILECLRIHL